LKVPKARLRQEDAEKNLENGATFTASSTLGPNFAAGRIETTLVRPKFPFIELCFPKSMENSKPRKASFRGKVTRDPIRDSIVARDRPRGVSAARVRGRLLCAGLATENELGRMSDERIRNTLSALLSGDETVVEHLVTIGSKAFARSLNLSDTTLRRHLKNRSSGLRTVAASWRQRRLREELPRGVSLASVAARLRFSDASALSRATQRWFGMTPKELGQRLQPAVTTDDGSRQR